MAAIRNHLADAVNTVSVDDRIVETVREVLAGAFPLGLRSVVLTGSLARREGTWVHDRGCDRLAGDAEFIVVFEERSALPSAERLSVLARAVENHLHQGALEVHIDLTPVRPGYIRSLRPHIFAYELLEHGRVILGDTGILRLARKFSVTDIPLEDGFHLLVNRVIELLETLCNSSGSMSHLVNYRLMKLWLDMATSFLLFQGQYESTYRRRAQRLAQMASTTEALSTGSIDAPIPLSRFNERVSLATYHKLSKTDRAADIAARRRAGAENDLAGFINDAHSLWRWELMRLTGKSMCASDDELLSRWITAQDVVARMRGWAATAKRSGLQSSARLLPRWALLALNGSPRRMIYAAASQLFFALPTILADGSSVDPYPFVALRSSGQALTFPRSGGRTQWARITRKLPVMNQSEGEGSWRSVGRAIAWNYHQFLEATRS